METIGISGNPGAGKTTLANSLFLHFETRVIHLDHILDSVKDILPKRMFVSIDRPSEETVKMLKKGSFFQIIKNNKYLLHLYLNAKWNLSRYILDSMLYNYSKENVDYVIIEGYNLETIIPLEKLDCSILVEAPFDVRVQRLKNRNHPNEFNYYGNPAYEDISDTSDLKKYDYKFVNNSQGSDFYNSVINLQMKVFNHNRHVRCKKL